MKIIIYNEKIPNEFRSFLPISMIGSLRVSLDGLAPGEDIEGVITADAYKLKDFAAIMKAIYLYKRNLVLSYGLHSSTHLKFRHTIREKFGSVVGTEYLFDD